MQSARRSIDQYTVRRWRGCVKRDTEPARLERLRSCRATLRTMIGKLIPIVTLCGCALAAEQGEEIHLWRDGAPGAEKAAEVSEPMANSKLPKRFTVVHKPSIYVFLPPRDRANGAAA